MEPNRNCPNCRELTIYEVADVRAPSTDSPSNSVKTGLKINLSRSENEEDQRLNLNFTLKTELTLVKCNENRERLFACCITNECNIKTLKIELKSNDSPKKIVLLDSAKKASSTFLESQIDPYTNKPFKELIQKNKESQLPYFLATCTDLLGEKIAFYDGPRFLLNYYEHEDTEDLLTSVYLNSFKMYKSTKAKNIFKLFCDSKNLNDNNREKAKFVFASDASAEAASKGKTAIFVTDYYEEKFNDAISDTTKYAKYLGKATFWLERAVKLKNSTAYWKLGSWFLNGTLKTEHPSLVMALPCFKLAIDYSEPDNENLERMKTAYNKMLNALQTTNSNNG